MILDVKIEEMIFIPRVISGDRKGLRLKAPNNNYTRPTTDRVKESLFNILNPYIDGSLVLDLFSGTGSLAIESLSRGAKKAFLVENNKNCASIINQNILHTNFENNAEILCLSTEKAIELLSQKKLKFDMIFMDPPYNKNFVALTLHNLIKNDIIENKSIIVIERNEQEWLYGIHEQYIKQFLNLKREEKYGDTIISFLVKE